MQTKMRSAGERFLITIGLCAGLLNPYVRWMRIRCNAGITLQNPDIRLTKFLHKAFKECLIMKEYLDLETILM